MITLITCLLDQITFKDLIKTHTLNGFYQLLQKLYTHMDALSLSYEEEMEIERKNGRGVRMSGKPHFKGIRCVGGMFLFAHH
ncbi:hypothetical protein Scep_026190 [Stephania cephalantha]|uniref:Uncharacterized protein n=1 Tax=Stephania cephalantha TaxID=152367 RepID=A0AAP0EJP5_9MAGN